MIIKFLKEKNEELLKNIFDYFNFNANTQKEFLFFFNELLENKNIIKEIVIILLYL
jgi:hypothetical protein